MPPFILQMGMASSGSAVPRALGLGVLLLTELVVPSMARRDPYAVLRVSQTATDRDIKKAFHHLAVKFHPDKNKSPDAELRFREIVEAYEVLSDQGKRRAYDLRGHRVDDPHKDRHFGFDDLLRHFGDFGFSTATGRESGQRGQFGGGTHNTASADAPNSEMHRVLRDFFDAPLDGFGRGKHFGHNNNGGGGTQRACRTVTQRVGNMVASYTECGGS
uniref:dnaJ homolog subfamily B member 9-like isoform X1 n=2 Tax=Myxine glutinosa TaxID=7769 RepID=UPI00358E032D